MINDRSRLKTIGVVIALAGVALLVAIGLLVNPVRPKRPAAEASAVTATPLPTSTVPSTPTVAAGLLVPAQADEVVATVNGQPITGAAWDRAVRVDTAMNALAGRSAPRPDDILARLTNEKLLLASGKSYPAFTTADAEARVQKLLAGWQATEPQLLDVLAAVNLSRQDLLEHILDLLAVEAVMQQFTTEGVDPNAWLEQARAQNASATPATSGTLLQPETVAAILATPEPDLPVQPYPDALAPDFSLYTLNNEPINLKALRGKPALLNFWATWCPPCRQEMPDLQAAYEQYGADLNFLAVNVKESAGVIAPFVQEMGATFPVLVDEDGAVSGGLYEVSGIPTTFFLDARGVIVARHVGPLTEDTIASYLQPLLPTPSFTATAPALPATAPAENPDLLFTATDSRGEPFDLAQTLKTGPVVLVFYRGRT